MKKAVISGVRQVELIDAPVPKPKEDWVLIKVHAVPLCTEYKGWLAGQPYGGHEAAGEVVEVPQPCSVQVGDRVVVMPQFPCGSCALCISGEYIHCQNNYDYQAFTGNEGDADTHVQYLVKPARLLVSILEGMSYELASLACCGLGPTFGALENLQITAFDTVLITGGGPVGLGGVVNAKYRGASVILTDPVPYRRDKAKELGADLVLDSQDPGVLPAIMDYTESLGVDAGLECAGAVEAQRLCIDAARTRGHIMLIGECSDPLPAEASSDFIRKGLSLTGQWHYNFNGIPRIMEVIQNSPVVSQLISHVLPLRQMQEALEIDSQHQSAKIILKPWE